MIKDLYYKLCSPRVEYSEKVTPKTVLKQLFNIVVWLINLFIFWIGIFLIMTTLSIFIFTLIEGGLW